jgi:hypothetical protein
MLFFLTIILAANAFAANWNAKGKYEKCMETEDGFFICRENFVNNFCYGKERIWINHRREKPFLDRNEEKVWYNRTLVAVRNLNSKCEYHGWSKFKHTDGTWGWKCYLNNREMQDSSCKGFTKR